MNANFVLPLEASLAAIFVIGVCAASLANLGVYRLAWNQRLISPWSPAPPEAPPRRWPDRIPVFGWIRLRRESAIHGRGFWIRPALVELLAGMGLAWLYWWEVDQRRLLPAGLPAVLPLAIVARLHVQFLVHAVLAWLMLVGSLIDADEKTIPDAITVPGTLFGLAAAAIYPWSLFPVVWFEPPAATRLGLLTLTSTSPSLWPQWLAGFPGAGGLAVGLGCWWLWTVGLMRRTWYARHGWRRAWQLMSVRLVGEFCSWRGVMGLIGSVAIAVGWYRGHGTWVGLLTALVGMAASGGLVWLVRIIGKLVLGREAMGFGDVTLMAMLGTLLGWQGSVVVFFLAPIAGLIIGGVQLLLNRETEIPYGPFLCTAAMFVIVCWARVWEATGPALEMFGVWIAPVFAVVLVLLAVLLALVRLGRELLSKLWQGPGE